MKVVPFRELPVGWEAQNVLLMHQAFGSSWDPRRLGREHQYPPFADYLGLCALDEGKLVASVTVHRFPFRTREGEVISAGLGSVATLPTHRGRGLARKLVEEAHAREREAGIPFCFLYTGRSNVAHTLYEHLGYRDVLEFPRAVRHIPARARRLPAGWVWRKARATDRQVVEHIHALRTRNALGFTRRGFDWWSGPSGWFLVERDGRPRGYGQVEVQGKIKGCHEAIGLDRAARRVVLSALEGHAAGSWLLLGSASMRELGTERARARYTLSPGSYGVLMAAPLKTPTDAQNLGHLLGVDSPTFAHGSQDAF